MTLNASSLRECKDNAPKPDGCKVFNETKIECTECLDQYYFSSDELKDK